MIECSVCGWRHTVPCGREDCPHDAATHYHAIATALDDAVANGCLDELSKMSDEEIADDLSRHDSRLERLPTAILKAGVRAWLEPQAGRDLKPALEEAAEMLRKVATWPADDVQGLRYHALRVAQTIQQALDQPAGLPAVSEKVK